MRNAYSWKFVLTIALPLLLASLGAAVLTFDLIARVSTGANQADRERTRQIVLSALGAIQHQLANTVTDNSLWDDAVRNLYGIPQEDWVNDSYGVSSADGVNYDMMLVVDRQMSGSVTGYRRGEPFRPDPQSYFGAAIDVLLDRLPADTATHGSAASIMATPDGPAVVAAATILATSEDLRVPGDRPRYLVFAKFLTPHYLQAIGEQYVIDGLALLPPGAADEKADAVTDASGATVALIAWTDRRPGDIARAPVVQKAALVLGFLLSVVFGIGWLCWNLVRKIAVREATAQHDSLHDALSGLPNRKALNDEANRLLKTEGQLVTATYVDLDGFKEVNDTYGHETGDRLIRAVAAGMSYLAQGRALVSRLGGDEFVALFKGPSALADAQRFAAELIAFLASPFDFEGRLASVGASIGIAANADEKIEGAELLRRADIAMFKAKQAGKNRFCDYVEAFDSERSENRAIARELRDIVKDRSVEIAYQPVVDARSRSIIGVEALARWPASSPRRIAPDRFIGVAEKSGLIDELGNLILAKACADARHWPGLKLAVNISPVQLRNPAFVARTMQTIVDSGMNPNDVELEITESTLVDDVPRVKRMFDELRQNGIQIALDDFGTGFSSIGYLRQFDFDRIKIDRSIVSRVLSGTAEQSIVQGTMMMASGLAAQVTAEGVEDEDQINLLRLTGCTEMQGYYFFKPLPAADISRLVDEPLADLRARA